MLFFTEVPVCPKCKKETSHAITNPPSKPEHDKGNIGRPYYKCETQGCRKFYCFDDYRGVHLDNPLCYCRERSRRRVAGMDPSSTSNSFFLRFQCAKAACDCSFPEQDQGSLKTVPQAEIRDWIKLAIYTDGSGIHGKVGAAAVAPSLNAQKVAYLGRETASNVYAAEVLGVFMGLQIGIKSVQARIVIFNDNQAALNTMAKPRRQSGQHIVSKIIRCLKMIQSKGQEVELHWIPAHQGVEGNELADELAKRATGWTQIRNKRGKLIPKDTENIATKPGLLKHLKSAAKTVLNKQTQEL